MTLPVRIGRGALALALLLTVAAGCAKDGRGGAVAQADSAASAPPAPPVPPSSDLTDAQIGEVLIAAHQAPARTGALARSRARDPRARAYAERMVAEHGPAEEAVRAFLRSRQELPQPHPIAQQLTREGEMNRSRLGELYERDFDRAYADAEADYHEALLFVLDRSLLPVAETPEMRALLERTRPVVEAHLAEARGLQAALAGQ